MKYIYKKPAINLVVTIFDRIGTLLFRALKRRESPSISAPKKILVFKPDHIGDVLLCTPFLHVLKKKFPDSQVTVVVGEWACRILAGNPDVDNILIWNAPWLTRGNNYHGPWTGLIEIIAKIRKEQFDRYYCLRSDLIGNIIGALSAIPFRAGFLNGGGGFLLSRACKESDHVHQTANLLQVLQDDSEKADTRIFPRVYISNKERAEAKNVLKGFDLDNRPLAGFNLSAGYSSKIWSVEKFSIVMKKIVTRLGYRPVILGPEEDMPLWRQIENVADGCDTINLIGRIDLGVSLSIIQKCRVFVGNDSAPVHIAASLGVPTVIVFSSANSPARWSPVGRRVRCVHKEIPCKLCEKSHCIDNKCLRLITTEEVFEAVRWCISTDDRRQTTDGRNQEAQTGNS